MAISVSNSKRWATANRIIQNFFWLLVCLNAFAASTFVPPGKIVALGYDDGSGRLSVPSDVSDVIAVAAGNFHGVALRTNGTVRTWGGFPGGLGISMAPVPASATNVVSIAASGYGGTSGSMALRADGSVVLWGGYGGSSFTNFPTGWTNIVS